MKYRSSKGKSAVIVSSSFNLSTACVRFPHTCFNFLCLHPSNHVARRQRLKTLGSPAPRDCDPPVSPSGALDHFSRERGSDEGHQTYYSDDNHAHPTAHTINAIPHQLLHAIAFTASLFIPHHTGPKISASRYSLAATQSTADNMGNNHSHPYHIPSIPVTGNLPSPPDHIPSLLDTIDTGPVGPIAITTEEEEDTEARDFLKPIEDKLRLLSQTTPEKMPPQHLNLKAKSHQELLHQRMIPIYDFIRQQMQDMTDSERLRMELRLWYVEIPWPRLQCRVAVIVT
jgi:hypothetical protein